MYNLLWAAWFCTYRLMWFSSLFQSSLYKPQSGRLQNCSKGHWCLAYLCWMLTNLHLVVGSFFYLLVTWLKPATLWLTIHFNPTVGSVQSSTVWLFWWNLFAEPFASVKYTFSKAQEPIILQILLDLLAYASWNINSCRFFGASGLSTTLQVSRKF